MCLDKLRDNFPAVYCATVVFDMYRFSFHLKSKVDFVIFSFNILHRKRGAAPVFKSLILGRPIMAEILIERIPMNSIPKDSEEASQWLHENYLHKVHNLNVVHYLLSGLAFVFQLEYF